MNAATAHHPSFPGLPTARSRGGFALVITLLILSLLVVVAVSYLSSMVGEQQTANAFTSKTRAEDMAQAGVDSATAILKESFRDFPDSATVWDSQQTVNADGSYNEGTSLYLRAVPDTNNYANPVPAGAPSASNANAPGGNNPGNPACKNFVLPLISGVPGGQAQLVSNKTNIFPKPLDSKSSDPGAQTGTDLNVLRGKGDTQGVIGTPPKVINGGVVPASSPKPAQAYWVPLKSSVKDTNGNAPIIGRYAFWIEDESFRVNNNYYGAKTANPTPPTAPPDNLGQPTPLPASSPSATATPAYRSLQPDDSILGASLTRAGDSAGSDDALTIFKNRANYPGSFFPDPLAFAHALPAASPNGAFAPGQTDLLRYFMTNQSGTLNLTRHGTQRVNLNALIPQTAPGASAVDNPTLLRRVTQIVQTLKYHLPYLGERFYRNPGTSKTLTPAILNAATTVPGSPKADSTTIGNDHSEIYYWKVAANLEDYIDTDTQPTIIMAPPTGSTNVSPTIGTLPGQVESINADQANQLSEIWAQGKESSPFLTEAAVRWRPIIHNHAAGATPPYAYDLYLDYYVEFWNMSDRDIYASPQTDPTLPNLRGAKVHISNQQTWDTYPSHSVLVCDGPNPYKLGTMGPDTDFDIDLTTSATNTVYQGGGTQPVNCVVFKAGSCTVITTDPDYGGYIFQGPPGAVSTSKMPPVGTSPSVNLATTYYCKGPGSDGQRHYTGHVTPATQSGIYSRFRDNYYSNIYHEDDEVHIALYNGYGYLDSSSCAISEHGGPQWINTDTQQKPGGYNDFSYSSCLMGNVYDSQLYFNVLPSELGDPRTNNEQLSITQSYVPSGTADQSRFFYGSAADTTLGYPNGQSLKPDQPTNPVAQGAYAWPDYYALPGQSGAVLYPAPTMTTAPMVVADSTLNSVGQFGDIFDPARLPDPNNSVTVSRGGGRTFKVGQHDDLYSYNPTGSANTSNSLGNDVPASNGWAAWRLADVFDVADPIELPARININGIFRDNGAALLSLLQGFKFQPVTSTDPVVHGDGHPVTGSTSLATQPFDAASSTAGFSQLINQITARFNNSDPTSGPSGPFFERGELGELGVPGSTTIPPLFGSNPTGAYGLANNKLVANVDMNKAFDHGREELVRRISQMICTRGDTFTIYAVGQSISQPTTTSAMRVTGTQRLRVTCRLVPKTANDGDFHPGYTVDAQTGAITAKVDAASFADKTRFAKPDHYGVQILQTSVY